MIYFECQECGYRAGEEEREEFFDLQCPQCEEVQVGNFSKVEVKG